MTLSSTIAKVSHSGNGITAAFGFAYYFLAETDLLVVLVDADGTEHVQIVNSHYTVGGAGNPAGGTVTMAAAPASGKKLVIKRRPALIQATDYATNDAFPAQSHEDALDRRAMAEQSLQEELDRALKVPIGDAAPNVALPAAAIRANKALIFDAGGHVAVSVDDYADQAALSAASAASAAGSAVAAAADASAAATSATGAGNSANAAAASATAASASASAAGASAGASSASATAAAASETIAAASAAKLAGSSATSVAIGTGGKVFATQANKFFDAGVWLLITSDVDPANYLHGQVTSYAGTSLTVDVADTGGAGTFAAWTIRVSGTRGSIGATGATGPTGPIGPQGPAGAGTGDMLAADYDPDNDRVIAVAQGGTGAATAVGARTALGSTTVGDAVFVAANAAAGRSALGLGALATAASVATANIDADAVTFAKMQNLASDRLLGRDTAGAGDPEEISVGGGLEFSGSTAIQRSALTGDITATAGSNATTIASNAVTTAKIADANVTKAKIENVAASKLLGRGNSGTGAPQEITLGTGLSMSSTTLNAGVPALSATFVSSQQTITAGGGLTLAHSLPSRPALFAVELICVTAELGYSVGDVLPICWGTGGNASSNNITWMPDATNLNVRIGAGGNVFAIGHKSTGVGNDITKANWRIVIRAWA